MGGEPCQAKKSIWRSLPSRVSADPLRWLGLLALMAYIELLVPTQLFYRTLQTTPGAAGLEGIDVLLQRSALLLAGYALMGAICAAGYFVLAYPFVVAAKTRKSLEERSGKRAIFLSAAPTALGLVLLAISLGYAASLGSGALLTGIGGGVLIVFGFFMPWIVFKDPQAVRKAARREAIDQGPAVAIGGLAVGATMLLLISIALAIPYANQIKKGRAPDDFLFPWQARHVQAIWKSRARPPWLQSCDVLIYLGEDSGRVLLYDSGEERALRINSSNLELGFPEAC